MKMTDGDHLKFWHSDLSKYTNDAINELCVQWLIGKVILYRFPGLSSFELNFQYGRRWWPSSILMFGLVKIQEMIPGNKDILLKTSFSREFQQVIWVTWLKTEKKMKLADGDHLEFLYLNSSIYKNDARNGLSMPHLVGKVISHRFLWPFT